jgi:NAD(P)-dependent dehydrogenase (short-subunit alcohol dehydrogenase family)
MNMTKKPTDKRAIITGSALGIGRAIASRLAADGYSVVVNYRTSQQHAEELCREISQQGGFAVPIQADVTDPAAAERLLGEAHALLGGVDVVVHNAGEFCWRPLAKMSVPEWDAVLKSNLSSAFYLFRAAYPFLCQAKAPTFVCIGLSPADSVRAAVNVGAYAIAKLALQMFTRTLAAEVAPEGIRVNLVAPGLIDNGHLPKAQREWMAKRVPAGRLGQLEDVASAVSFLISDEAQYVNGATLAVSGGWDWLDRDATHDCLIHETFAQEVQP